MTRHDHFCWFRALLLLPALGWQLDAGAVVLESALLSSAAGERAVELPHRLGPADRNGRSRLVRYRLEFDLPPGQPDASQRLGIFVAAVGQSGRMSLNGNPVGACAPGPLAGTRCLHRPWLVDPPRGLWQPGRNVIEVEVHAESGQLNGLSAVEVDAYDHLHASRFRPQQWLRVRAIDALAWVGLCVGVLALVAGRALPSVRFLPAFGLACLCNAAGNLLMITSGPFISAATHGWIGFALRLFGFVFALLTLLEFFSNGGAGRWRIGLGYAALASALFPLSSGLGPLTLSALLYAPLMATTLLLLPGLVRRAWNSGHSPHRMAAAWAALLVFACALDWLQLAGLRPYGQPFVWAYAWSATALLLAAAVLDMFLREARRVQLEGGELAAMAETSATEARLLRTAVEDQVRLRTLELEQLKDAAEADAAGRAHFLAVMSHEIRNNLTALLGGLDLLGQANGKSAGYQADKPVIDDLVGASARQLHALVGDLLDLSRFEAGRHLEIAREPVDIQALCTESLRGFSALASKKGVELRFSASGLPAGVQADRGKLRRVLDNLLSNAVKFTDQGRIELQASASPTGTPGVVALSLKVCDSGPGIEASLRPTLFQPYVQGGPDARSARTPQGTGLGLHLARQLMRLQGGDLVYQPGSHGGSVFEATLQVPEAPQTAVAPAVEPTVKQPSTLARHPLAGLRLLVVDDNEVVRKMMALKLQRWAVDVVTVASAPEALEHLAASRFDAVLMDLSMPDVGGIELTRSIRGLPSTSAMATPGSRVPIVGLSAWTLGIADEECRAAGMDECLPKPVPWEALTTVLVRLTGRGPGGPMTEAVGSLAITVRREAPAGRR